MKKLIYKTMIKLFFTRSNKYVHGYHNLSGGKVIYKKLLEHNVKDVFLYTGGAVMPLIDAFYKGKINYYLNTHEQSGGHAATGYAKSSGKPGISIVTSGPGLTNSITALTDATNDSTPFILFSGNVPLSAVGTNAFQECPSTDITKPVTKWSYCVQDVQELPDVVDEAFRVSLDGKPGSVHIDLPKCITMSKYNGNNNKRYKFDNKVTKEKRMNMEESHFISEIINNAKSPVLLIGQGCNNYSDELRKFAIEGNIPVTTTIHAMGIFDETHDLSLQFLGMHGNVTANHAIQNADLIIALGTRFDDRITGVIEKYAPNAFKSFKEGSGGIIHVNKNEDEIKSVIDSHYNFQVDCGDFLRSVKPTYVNRKKWTNKINNLKKKHPFEYNRDPNDMNTQEVIDEINNHLLKMDNYIISTGVGNHQMMASQFIKWRYPKSFISSGSLGVMGVGLPYAIGAQIANPNKLIIDIDGDGSFNHTLSELKTVQNYDLPIKIAIMNDNNFSMVRAWEELFFNKQYTATGLNRNPNYAELAESFGIKGITCSKRSDLKDTIKEFLSYDKAIVCDFRVVPNLCLPLVSPGSSLDDMVLFNDKNIIMKTDLPPS
jgi:acetolactate synthase-1/2/3 large subunit